MADTDETPELNLEEVVETDPSELSDDQKSFLEEHKSDLTPEQAEKFGIKQEDEKPEDIDPEVRGGKKTDEPDDKNKGKKKDGEEEEEGGDEDIDPDDKATINKVVDEKLKPVSGALERLQKLEDEKEVDTFLQSKPEFSKYRTSILKHISHPAYKQIPVHNIATMVAAKDLEKIGAQKERDAQKKVNETKGNGTGGRKQSGKVDWSTASPEEYAAKRAEVLGQQG